MVVGTRGRAGIGKALLGSVAEEILRHAPCPVLTVGPQACHETGRRGRMASILFATDFGAASLAAAPIAVSLAEEYQAKLTFLHVKESGERMRWKCLCDAAETCEQRLRALMTEEAKLMVRAAFCGGLRAGRQARRGVGTDFGAGGGARRGSDRDGRAWAGGVCLERKHIWRLRRCMEWWRMRGMPVLTVRGGRKSL